MKYKVGQLPWIIRGGRTFDKTWIRFILKFNNKSKWRMAGEHSTIKKERLKLYRFKKL